MLDARVSGIKPGRVARVGAFEDNPEPVGPWFHTVLSEIANELIKSDLRALARCPKAPARYRWS
jgi:hypothetical protein